MAVVTTPLGFLKPDGNELVKQGDNVIATNAQKSQELIGKVRADIANLQSAAGFPGDPITLQDSVVATLVGTGPETSSAIEAMADAAVEPVIPTNGARAVGKGELIFNALDYGAKGDLNPATGIGTDDTLAIQATINAAWGTFGQGGTALLPPSRGYVVSDAIELRSNVTIDFTGATLKKTGNATTSANVFVGKSRNGTGYGGGVQNVVIRGGKIEGTYSVSATSGAGITVHHGQNISFENVIWRTANVTGHVVDLLGCNIVNFEKCLFQGWSAATGKEYVEAIQIDHSVASGSGIDLLDFPGSYDGLPTQNVTVDKCAFLPFVHPNGTTYPAPNPLGNHGAVETMRTRNIKFTNNLVIDGRMTSDVGDVLRGWLHFYQVDNFHVEGNTFINTTGSSAVVVGVQTAQNGVLLTDRAVASPTVQPITPMPMTGFRASENLFHGFKGTATAESPIRILGLSAAKLEGVVIKLNEIRDCHPTGVAGTAGIAIAYVLHARNVNISENFGSDLKRMADTVSCLLVRYLNNSFTRTRDQSYRATDCTDVRASGNQVADGGQGLYFNNVTGLIVTENQINGMGGALLNITGCKDFLVRNNIIRAIGTVSEGISVWNVSTKGRVDGNFVLGSFTTPVSNLGSNVDVVVSGTVT